MLFVERLETAIGTTVFTDVWRRYRRDAFDAAGQEVEGVSVLHAFAEIHPAEAAEEARQTPALGHRSVWEQHGDNAELRGTHPLVQRDAHFLVLPWTEAAGS